MRKDPTEFRKRFAAWKNGELVYKDGLPTYKKGKNPIIYRDGDIPFIQDKAVKLTNAGLATGAILSTNMLDSIADAATRQGLDINTAIGLATKESTLGNPTDDTSVYQLLSPEKAAVFKKLGTGQYVNKYGDAVKSRLLVNYYKDLMDAGIGDDEGPVPTTNESVMDAAFRLYANSPQKYNPGQKNYLQLVDKRAKEISGSPEVKRWRNAYDTKRVVRQWTKPNLLLKESRFNKPAYKDGKLPGYYLGTESDGLGSGVYIGAIPFVLYTNNKQTEQNKLVDQKIADKNNYGWDDNIRSYFLNSPQWLKNNINPAWNIIDVNTLKVPFGMQDMSNATKDDNAFFQRHLGYTRDKKSMPVTGIRFAGDYNEDGTLRLPLAEYTGLSKQAKDFIRKGILEGKIEPNKDGSWTEIKERRKRWGKYTSHLGTYSIRENNNSGIYDVVDTYDFPWYNPILNRQEGKQIEIRDSIHGPNAKPMYYNINFSKKKNTRNEPRNK